MENAAVGDCFGDPGADGMGSYLGVALWHFLQPALTVGEVPTGAI